MSQLLKCAQCGEDIIAGDRFCGGCGFDTHSRPATVNQPAAAVNEPVNDLQRSAVSANQATPQAGNKNSIIILIIVLSVVFLTGGILYWWFSRGEELNNASISPGGQKTVQQANTPAGEELDLTRASTYLPEAGLKCSFYINYPDGTAGPMERFTARVVPAESVLISEVEMVDNLGEELGFGTHYIERPDGTYIIYDDIPVECSPVLKNNLMNSLNWNYGDEYGQTEWTVLEMGVTLDLGFTKIENCLLVEEDNQAVGVKKIIYFAPGMGRVMEKSSEGGTELLKLTAFTKVDQSLAAEKIKKWSPNYQIIKDDQTQT